MDKILLFPYFIILKLRHFLYNKRILKSYKYDIPIISVGNITVGGTGKTPHVEYLISILKNNYKIAVISRGYKRTTKGYREVLASDSYLDVGDEPIQIKRKFQDIIVAVDSSRKRAIEKLLMQESKPTLILLDDAFQHRRINPTISIVLVDYNRPIHTDSLLPIGRLRDIPSEIKRADIVIVTKCPSYYDEDPTRWRKNLKLDKHQQLLFSKIEYMEPQPIFPESDNRYLYSKFATCFSGIANDALFKSQISTKFKLISTLKYADHHKFSHSDIREIGEMAKKHPQAIILTTEKDTQRILSLDIPLELKFKLFYIPIQVQIETNIEDPDIMSEEEIASARTNEFKKVLTLFNIQT